MVKPKIIEDAQALDWIDDHLDNTGQLRHQSEILGYAATVFIVGVTMSDGEKRIYYVGPRGGLTCLIRADRDWAPHLARFFS